MDLGIDAGGGRKTLVVDEVLSSDVSQEDMFRCMNPITIYLHLTDLEGCCEQFVLYIFVSHPERVLIVMNENCCQRSATACATASICFCS
jgi:hypothetical protein